MAAVIGRFVALCALALLCSSCLPVPFDLSASQSVLTASKMTRDTPAAVVTSYDPGGSQTGYAFSPTVLAGGGFDYAAGFVTFQDNLAMGISAVWGGSQYGFVSQAISTVDPHASSCMSWPLKAGESFIFASVFDRVDPTQNKYTILNGVPGVSVSPLDPTVTFQKLLGGPPQVAVGASVTADPGTFDDLHVLAFDPAGSTFLELEYQLQAAALGTGTPLRSGGTYYALPFLPSIPSPVARILYFYDDNRAGDAARSPNRSFASWRDPSLGSWVTYAWDSLTSNKRLPADRRIDALLTTGQLLSTEGDTGRLYDRDGNQLATFPLGGLVYIGEQYVGGVARAYFSQCLIYSSLLHFKVYWIPTAQLASLGS